MIKGADIKRLIPQRNPIMMVDEFEALTDNSAQTALTVRSDNMFLYEDGTLAESGLIEHIAQSASALAGFLAEGSEAPIGIIGEVKHFCCHRRPQASEKIVTTVTFGFTFGSATLIEGTSCVGDETIAEAKMKIFIQS